MIFEPVSYGSTGICVYILQALFRALQYTGADGMPIEVDGTAGENTIYAINSFQEIQRAYGFECGSDGTNDGVFGAACWQRLGMI